MGIIYLTSEIYSTDQMKCYGNNLFPAVLLSIFSGKIDPLNNKDDIILLEQQLAVGKLDSAAYSRGPHLYCAKFKACLKRT